MLAHQRGDAPSLRGWSHDIAAIADVCAQTRLIGFDEVGADDCPFQVAGDEGLCRHLHPNLPNLLLRALRRERIGVARPESLLQDRPKPWPIRLTVLTNLEHGTSQIRAP